MSDSKIKQILKDITPEDDKGYIGYIVTTLDDERSLCHVGTWIPSGCLPIDLILGGGFPVGRLTEIYGDNSTGKSLLAAQAVASAQAMGALALFADVESAVSLDIMEAIGVDVENLLYYTPDTVQQVFEVLESAIESKNKHLGIEHPMIFVWDSVAATTTLAEIEETDLDKKMYASAAPQISRAMRTGIVRRMAKSNVCSIFINQTREKIGVLFGEKVVTFGGKAIGFYATIRICLSSSSIIKDAKRRKIGIVIDVETVKNKIHPPFRRCTAPVYFGLGIDETEAMFDFAKDLEVITVSGSRHRITLNNQDYTFIRSGWHKFYNTHQPEIEEAVIDVYSNG